MRNLRIALSKKEKASGLLERLEELRKAGEVDDDAYATKKEQYERLAQEGEAELEAIHATLTTKLEALKRDLEKFPQELKDLELSNKLGEIDSAVFTATRLFRAAVTTRSSRRRTRRFFRRTAR